MSVAPRRLLLAATLLALPAPALGFELTWSAPPPCPGRDAVLARLQAAGDTSRRLSARATVTRDDDARGWTLRLGTDDGAVTGERELSAPSCDDLTDAAVLVLAVALDAIDDDDAPAPAPPPASAPSPVVAPAAPRVVTRVARRGTRTRGGVRASVGVTFGLLPSPALIASLRAWVARGRWRVELLGAWSAAQTVSLPAGASAELGALAVGLRACRSLARLPVELGACAGLDVGVMQGRGAGVLRPSDGASTFASAVVGASATWQPARGFALVASLDGQWMFDRPRFVILGVGEVHTPSPLGLAASLGAEASW